MEAPASSNTGNSNKLIAIDLFSGIGGISLALQDYIQVIQYCEIDPFCQSVLTTRMKAKDIDQAPIHGDIRTLHISPVCKPQIIVGGFPCQDVSSIGLMKGITDGTRSGLFYEIMRLVDENDSIEHIFLENVSNITNCGLLDVITELTKRNFDFQWLTKSAAQLGAPHVRSRWFCYAFKNQVLKKSVQNLTKMSCKQRGYITDWSQETPHPRVTFRPSTNPDESYDDNWIQRCQTLGNTVVPYVVHQAFTELMMMSEKWQTIKECFLEYSHDVKSLSYPLSDNGIIISNRFYNLPKPNTTNIQHSIDIQIIHEGKTIKYNNYPTPRRGITHCSTLTERSIRDLPTVLVHSTKARDYISHVLGNDTPHLKTSNTSCVPNVRYIEWMMGFPTDWTKTNYLKGNKVVYKHTSDDAITDNKNDETIVTPVNTPNQGRIQVKRLNGMHMLMKDNPGKDVRHVAKLWKELTDAERKSYSQKAKNAY